jgi:hypothetical protein
MTFLNWLIILLVVSLASIVILLLILNHKERKMWMKAFGTQYGISPASMEPLIKKEPTVPRVDTRQKISIPIPGNDMFRKSPHQRQ